MKNAAYYMTLPYTTIIEPINDESGFYYMGRIMEFEGCMTDGDTKEETLQNLQEAMELWIETKLSNGFEVPEPIADTGVSGKFTLRLPKTLHKTAISSQTATATPQCSGSLCDGRSQKCGGWKARSDSR